VTGYIAKLDQLRQAGVDRVLFIASNDAFVMSAWGKANGIKDESIVRLLCPVLAALLGTCSIRILTCVL